MSGKYLPEAVCIYMDEPFLISGSSGRRELRRSVNGMLGFL